jgi:hypothetical protein
VKTLVTSVTGEVDIVAERFEIVKKRVYCILLLSFLKILIRKRDQKFDGLLVSKELLNFVSEKNNIPYLWLFKKIMLILALKLLMTNIIYIYIYIYILKMLCLVILFHLLQNMIAGFYSYSPEKVFFELLQLNYPGYIIIFNIRHLYVR